MSSHIIDGVFISDLILSEVRDQISALTSLSKTALSQRNSESDVSELTSDELLHPPHLAVVIVGDRKDSAAYVKRKVTACERVGIKSSTFRLPLSTTEKELLHLISELNSTDHVDGILVQVRKYSIHTICYKFSSCSCRFLVMSTKRQ